MKPPRQKRVAMSSSKKGPIENHAGPLLGNREVGWQVHAPLNTSDNLCKHVSSEHVSYKVLLLVYALALGLGPIVFDKEEGHKTHEDIPWGLT